MKCGKPVTVEYIWAGQRHFACLKHAEKIEKLGIFMGMSTQPRLIISDMTCPSELSKQGEENRNG